MFKAYIPGQKELFESLQKKQPQKVSSSVAILFRIRIKNNSRAMTIP